MYVEMGDQESYGKREEKSYACSVFLLIKAIDVGYGLRFPLSDSLRCPEEETCNSFLTEINPVKLYGGHREGNYI